MKLYFNQNLTEFVKHRKKQDKFYKSNFDMLMEESKSYKVVTQLEVKMQDFSCIFNFYIVEYKIIKKRFYTTK